jgi:hypothetical protein
VRVIPPDAKKGNIVMTVTCNVPVWKEDIGLVLILVLWLNPAQDVISPRFQKTKRCTLITVVLNSIVAMILLKIANLGNIEMIVICDAHVWKEDIGLVWMLVLSLSHLLTLVAP